MKQNKNERHREVTAISQSLDNDRYRTILFYPLANQLMNPNMNESVFVHVMPGLSVVFSFISFCVTSVFSMLNAQRHFSQWTFNINININRFHFAMYLAFCVYDDRWLFSLVLMQKFSNFRLSYDRIFWYSFKASGQHVYMCGKLRCKTPSKRNVILCLVLSSSQFLSIIHIVCLLHISGRFFSISVLSISIPFSHLVMVLAHVKCSL